MFFLEFDDYPERSNDGFASVVVLQDLQDHWSYSHSAIHTSRSSFVSVFKLSVFKIFNFGVIRCLFLVTVCVSIPHPQIPPNLAALSASPVRFCVLHPCRCLVALFRLLILTAVLCVRIHFTFFFQFHSRLAYFHFSTARFSFRIRSIWFPPVSGHKFNKFTLRAALGLLI